MESKINYQLDAIVPHIYKENKHLVFFNQGFSSSYKRRMTLSTLLLLFFPPLKSSTLQKACLQCCVLFFCLQSMTSASADSTTATRMPCALTWSEATAAPVSRATLATGQSAKVSTASLVRLFHASCTYKSQYKTP